MGLTIAVMITKGGVGKSTLVMALAETLSVYHRKRVLIVDSDPQASVSSMLLPMERLKAIQESRQTMARFFTKAVLRGKRPDWQQFVMMDVSDVDDADTLSLIPSHVDLALFERRLSSQSFFSDLSHVVASLIRDANTQYDVVLVDCPPGLTVLTEVWMRQADYHLAPTKPDYLGLHGLEILSRFEALSGGGFSKRLGVVVNMMDTTSAVDRKVYEMLMSIRGYRCFAQSIPDHISVKHAAVFHPEKRSFMAKYPGVAHALRLVTEELLARLAPTEETDQAEPFHLSSSSRSA